jgi:hypothetical protein
LRIANCEFSEGNRKNTNSHISHSLSELDIRLA